MTTVPDPPMCACGCGERAPSRRKWIPGHRASKNAACSYPECNRVGSAGGLCNAHYKRSRKGTSMDEPIRAWGESTYRGIHQKLRYHRGPASNYQCTECGERARHWAFDNMEPKEQDPENGLYFYDDLTRYRPMCDPCHLTYDRGFTRCPHGQEFFEDGRCHECRRIYARDRGRALRKLGRAPKKKPMSAEKREETNRLRRERYASDPDYRERAKRNSTVQYDKIRKREQA